MTLFEFDRKIKLIQNLYQKTYVYCFYTINKLKVRTSLFKLQRFATNIITSGSELRKQLENLVLVVK